MLTRNGVNPDADLEAHMDMIMVMVEGWTSRMVRNPGIDREAYLEMLRDMFSHMLSGECAAR